MNAYRSFGLFGLAVLLFGLLGGVVTGEWTSLYVLVHLIGGSALLALYLFTHLESLRESVAGRRTQYATNTVVYSLVTLGVIGLLNYLGVQHSWRYDATEAGIFSLAPQTRQVLEELDEAVEAFAFFREGEEQRAEDLLEAYAYLTDRFTYQLVDPDKRPELAEELEVTQYGTIVLKAGEETTRITEVDEEALTNALIRVAGGRKRRLYFAVGHGEPDLEDRQEAGGYGQLKAALENEGYEVATLLLATVPDVPADADAVVVAGPRRPFLEHELEVLRRHLDRGGKLLVMLDPETGEDLVAVLAERGVAVGADVVVDQVIRLFAGPALGVEPIVGDYGFHPITEDFSERTIFSLVRSVAPADDPPDGITVTTLARTSPNSWAETDVERLFGASEAGLDEEDETGPVSIAVAATLEEEALEWSPPRIATAPGEDETVAGGDADEAVGEEDIEQEAGAEEEAIPQEPPDELEGRLVVFGDSDWVNNRFLGLYFNEDLFLNAIGWLAGEEELISIRPRTRRASRVVLTQAESWAVFYSSVLLLPELVLLAGLAIWWRRRL